MEERSYMTFRGKRRKAVGEDIIHGAQELVGIWIDKYKVVEIDVLTDRLKDMRMDRIIINKWER